MELPFMGTVSADDFENGTAAAIAGGTTTIIDFVVPGRGANIFDALKEWKEKAKKAVADYAFHMALTGWFDHTAEDMRRCVQEEGVTSFKVFMAYKGSIGIDDGELWQALETAGKLGCVLSVHAENGDVIAHLQKKFLAEGKTDPKYHALSRPSALEGEATARFLALARMTGAKVYVVHMTCREAVDALAMARQTGQNAYGETCPQYLLLDDSVYEKPNFEGAAFVMSPPIRPKGHGEVLWQGLQNGTLQAIGTDHCPFMQEGQKEMGRGDFTKIPNGAAGVENRLGLIYTHGVEAGRFDLCHMVDLLATAPARIFHLYPQKGTIAPGTDADLVIYDPTGENTIAAAHQISKCDRNVFEGMKVKGKPIYVIAAGRVQYKDGDLRVERGKGRFLKRRLR
jgi:dihydropyrimidinase